MKEKDICYTAGFFDGDGHICFEELKQKRTKKGWSDVVSYRIAIRLVNTNLPVIKKMQKLWGGFIYKRKMTDKRRTQAYDLIIVRKEAIKKFIELVYPHLIVRKNQVEKAIESYKLARGRSYYE